MYFYLFVLCLFQLIIFTSQYPSHVSFCTWPVFAHILYAFSFHSQMNTIINLFQTTRKWNPQFFCFQFFSLHAISIKPKCAAQRQYLSESCHLRDVLAEGRIFTKDDEVSSADLGCVTSLGDCMNDCSCHGDFAGCLKGSHEEMERDELEQIIVKRAEQPCVKFRPFKE